jgi:hypothetical protein
MASGEAEIGPDGVAVDAAVVARAFGLDPATVPAMMRAGAITSRLEKGVDEDAGTWRLTFFHRNARFTLIVGDDGRILRRSTLDYGEAPLPTAVRRR